MVKVSDVNKIIGLLVLFIIVIEVFFFKDSFRLEVIGIVKNVFNLVYKVRKMLVNGFCNRNFILSNVLIFINIK